MSIANMVMRDPGRFSVQQLQQAMERGVLPAYIAIPIIQEKVQQQKQAQQQTAMQQEPQPPIAQQIMQEAQGVAALPTNLPKSPEEYAAGGIVAFAGGGDVERYQTGGLGARPPSLSDQLRENQEKARKRQEYEEFARQRAVMYGVPQDIALNLFAAESGFNPTAVSPKGAVGLGQIMPGTGRDLGLKPEELTDPYKNIDASLRYFKQQMDKFGDPRLAAAAYNMGPGALASHLEQNKGLNIAQLPNETQKYLTRVVPKERTSGRFELAASEPPPQLPSLPSIPRGLPGLPTEGVSPEFDMGVGGFNPEDVDAAAAAMASAPASAPVATSVPPSTGAPAPMGALNLEAGRNLRETAPSPLMQEGFATQMARRAISEYKTETARLEDERDKALEAIRSGMPKDKAQTELEQQLRKEAEEMGANKEQAKYMALLKAGLAIMSGKSPNALQNLSLGIVGIEDYQAALKDLRRAEKANQAVLANIEQARRAETIGDVQKQEAAINRTYDNLQTRNALMFSALERAGSTDAINELRRLLAGQKQTGSPTETQLYDRREKIAENLKAEGFELKMWRDLTNNKKLESKEIPNIVKKYPQFTQQVEEARRMEIERRLREGFGKYSQAGAPQQNQFAGMELLGVRPE